MGHERGAPHLAASAAVVARVAVATAVADGRGSCGSGCGGGSVSSDGCGGGGGDAQACRLRLRAVAGGRAARGGGGQDDTCTREGGVGVRQREGAQARPLGADGEEGRPAGRRSPAVHRRRRRRHIRSWRRERLPGASPPLGDYPRPRRPRAGGGPKPDGVSGSIMRE